MSNVGNHNSNPLILSYNGTCCIYQSDLQLLESDSEWLNDSCINFQMTRLSERTVEAATTITTAVVAVADDAETASKNDNGANSTGSSSSNNDSNDPIRIVFMDPSIVSFFMHQISIDDDEDRDEILGLYNNTWELNTQYTQTQKKLKSSSQQSGSKMVAMMIPINDNHAGSSWAFQTAGAGNHWSLLVVLIYIEDLVEHNTTTSTSIPSPRRRRPNYARYFHFDSCHGCNSSAAKIVATRVERLLSIGVIDASRRSNNDTSANTSTVIGDGSMMESKESRELPKRMKTSVAVVDCVTPQQSNGYDCGLCTLANSEALSSGIDAMPRRHRRREDCENGSGAEGGDGNHKYTYDDDDKEVKKWLEQTVKSFMIGYGGMGKMAKSIRRKMAADVREMKGSNH